VRTQEAFTNPEPFALPLMTLTAASIGPLKVNGVNPGTVTVNVTVPSVLTDPADRVPFRLVRESV
jgi:hypothetical protein